MFEPVCFIQDIDNLQQVWEITQDWSANWNIWKVGQFATLQMDRMESTTQDMFKKLHKLQRELKVCYYIAAGFWHQRQEALIRTSPVSAYVLFHINKLYIDAKN